MELLQGLQAALPRSDDEDTVAELKELLTNLIIMQNRLGERDARLGDLLGRLVEARPVDASERVKLVASGGA